jgi:kojibiose phosphorylase
MQDAPLQATPPVDGNEATSARRLPLRPHPAIPRELEHPFRLIAFDWDGTAVDSRKADATRVVGLLDRLMTLGARVAIVTGTNLRNVMHQVAKSLLPENGKRFYVSTNRGSELFGFDRRGKPELIWSRVATADEDEKLDRVANLVKEHLERALGIPIGVVLDRMNRRKIDLIPEPAWADPPKSHIGELLAATEARLRGAGLRGGIREAFELTERVAKDVGLEDAKVTSDVKHIEVGLTDKADAMAVLFRTVAGPLEIAPEDILILGDEFGAVGGFEGSDHKMLDPKEAAGALVVSVGPEPGGTPAGIIHLGGGPERFCQVMERQLSLEVELGPFATPRDAAWVVERPGFDLAREHEIESVLAIGNGYVGSRDVSARTASVARPSTFLAGAFEPSNDVAPVPELVVLPEWRTAIVRVDGELLGGEGDTLTKHKRTLDMRRGRVLHEGHVTLPSGRAIEVRTFHLASLAERRLLLQGIELEPINFSGTVSVEASIRGDVRSASGAHHWATIEPRAGEVTNRTSDREADPWHRTTLCGPELIGITHGGLVAVMASEMRADRTVDTGATFERASGPAEVTETCARTIHIGEVGEVYRTVIVATSRDAPDPRAEVATMTVR